MSPVASTALQQVHEDRIARLEMGVADIRAELAVNTAIGQRIEMKLDRWAELDAAVKDLQASRKRWSRVVVWAGSGIGTVAVTMIGFALKSWMGL